MKNSLNKEGIGLDEQKLEREPKTYKEELIKSLKKFCLDKFTIIKHNTQTLMGIAELKNKI